MFSLGEPVRQRTAHGLLADLARGSFEVTAFSRPLITGAANIA